MSELCEGLKKFPGDYNVYKMASLLYATTIS